MISTGKCDASSHSIACGAISPSANSRTLRRRCCCSSVKLNSTVSSVLMGFGNTQTKFCLFNSTRLPLPAHRVTVGLVLFVPRQRLERFGPWFALPHRQHLV